MAPLASLMSPENDGPSRSELWDQVLAAAAGQLPPEVLEVWLRPSCLAGWDQSSCQVIVPNEHFREMWRGRFRELLEKAIQQVFGAPLALSVTVAPEPGAGATVPLPVVRACDLQAAAGAQWLIQDLWTAQAVGIIGGPPKACKTWLALDLAVSVASGSPCLGRFPVPSSGPVLLYAGEDSAVSLRFRLESLARARGLDFAQLEVGVITTDTLRLDLPRDQERFQATLVRHRPQLLVLDPLIRVHGADENASGPMAALLGFFRSLQRQTSAAIALVHHARKNGARSGSSLRGSSDFYAWTDCLLYLDRRRDRHTLLVEHRSAPGVGPFPLELVTPSASDSGPYLRVRSSDDSQSPPSLQPDPLPRQILNLLAASSHPLPADAIRSRLCARKQRVLAALRDLSAEGGPILRVAEGYLPRLS
jgi:hypothetical protein